jgi:ubiquinone/menaquinone biosynthesis C-methylase UbiE
MKNYKEDSRKTFDHLAVKYADHYYGKQSAMIYEKVISKIKSIQHHFILDLGCGQGSLLKNLANAKAKLFGADLSPEMIKYAQHMLGNAAELKVADSENLPWPDNSFDVIACILSFHHYPDPGRSLQEMKRVLQPNGHIIIAEPWLPAPFRNLGNLYMRSVLNRTGDVKVYSKHEWQHMLANAGFININMEKTKTIFLIITAQVAK